MSFWRRIALIVVGACIVSAVWLVTVLSTAAASPNIQLPGEDLGAILLDSSDVPVGFELKQSGFDDEPMLDQTRWLSRNAPRVPHYSRIWIDRQKSRGIIAHVFEYPLDKVASVLESVFMQYPPGKVEKRFPIASVPYARGLVTNDDERDGVFGVFVHGPGLFIIEAVLPKAVKSSDADIELIRQLVTIQATKGPPGSTKLYHLGVPWLQAEIALGACGATVTYIGVLSLLAWLRDPLRRNTPTPQPMEAPNAATVDVTAPARRRRRRATAGLVLDLSGATVTLSGLLMLQLTWLGLLPAAFGIGIVWIPRLLTMTARRTAVESRLWTGRRRLRVSCYASISTVCVLTGLFFLILYGSGANITSPAYQENILFFLVSAVFLALGTLVRRRARRLAALDAHEVLQRDPRPMVLYLRTFADDSLTIRTATYARRSFVDRLSPRRFERFEEMLVRNLTHAGPVVALNPPGTDLAPIGAARETLGADHWQPTITGWMTNARLIVVGAAPQTISQGFGWELHAIDSHQLWSKTLLVLPPIPKRTIHTRWEQFTKVLADTTMAHYPIPSDPARILVLLGSLATGWSAITADQRTEWTYAEALATTVTTRASTGQDQTVTDCQTPSQHHEIRSSTTRKSDEGESFTPGAQQSMGNFLN